MDTDKVIGRAKFKVKHVPTNDVSETIIDFEDRGQDIYYCWEITDSSGRPIAGKCLPINKRIIETDELEYCILHARTGIDSYRVGRQKVFQVEQVEKL